MTLLERYEQQAVLLRQSRELPKGVRENLAYAGLLRFLGLPQPINFDAHANFAYSTVATAPSPAPSGTSLVVASGDGAKFPTVPFNATVWPAGVQPLTSNAEIVRVTAKSTDTLTILRSQEGSSARSIGVGDQIAATITAKTLTDVESAHGLSVLVYRYTVSGSDKTSIDTGVDTPDAGSNDWTNGDLLEIWANVRTDDTGATPNLDLTFNNDTGANYDQQYIVGFSNTSTAAGGLTAQNSWRLAAHGSGGAASYASVVRASIPGYAGTTFFKTANAQAVLADTSTANEQSFAYALGWRSTSAITRIAIAPETSGKKLKVGSELLVYKRLA